MYNLPPSLATGSPLFHVEGSTWLIHTSRTFTYLIILRLATVCQIFRDIVPDDVEHVISIGRRNMELFSGSVQEFKHHLEILDRLDAACRDRMEV